MFCEQRGELYMSWIMNKLHKDRMEFWNISFMGRLAFAMSCMENVILKLELHDINPEAMDIIIKKMWEFANCEYLDEWHYSLSEILPEFTCEFEEYEKADFEYITEHDFDILYKFYTEQVGAKEMEIYENLFSVTYELSRAHIYTSVGFIGKSSLDTVMELVMAMEQYEVEIPNIQLYKKYKFSENSGFGESFDAKEIAKLLK